MDAKQQQVLDQCKAVSYLATQLASVHADKAILYAEKMPDGVANMVGECTARLMETLGNALNGMDAVDGEEDAWLDPIFERAHEMFPSAT